jgi:hypothetical protein
VAGQLGAMLAWHGDLQDRPAALDEAREAAELAAARAANPPNTNKPNALAAREAGHLDDTPRQARGKPLTGGQR